MLTQDQIDQAIKYLKTHKGELPSTFKRLNIEHKGDHLYVDGKEVVPESKVKQLIASYDADPKTTGGILRLWQHLTKRYYGISKGAVADYVSKSSVHQVHQVLPKKTTSRAIIMKAPNKQLQCDLIDMSEYEQTDKYALTAIDLFTKECRALPLKNKEGKTVAAALDQMLKTIPKPSICQTDNGKEFESEFDKVLTKHGIKHVRSLPYNPTSQASVERLNGSLKKDVQRMMTLKGTNNWVPLLADAVENHNTSKTRSTGVAPNDVTKEDTKEIAQKLNDNAVQQPSDRIFHVGDKVRVALTALDRKTIAFRKGVRQNWTDQIFTVRSVSKPISAGSSQQYLLEGSTKRFWSYQLLRIPDTVYQDHLPGERPKVSKKEKLDRLDKVDEDFEAKDVKQPEPKEGERPKRNRARRIYSNDYVYLG